MPAMPVSLWQICSFDGNNTLLQNKKRKKLVREFCCALQTKSQVLHLPVPLFSSLLFPLSSKHPIRSFLIIHSSTKRFCLLFILQCDIFFMLEMFGMPLKVVKSFCGGTACRKKVFLVECLLSNITVTSPRFSPPFTVCEL